MLRPDIAPELAILGTSLATASRKLPAARSLRTSVKLPLTCLASVAALVVSLQARVDAALINGLVAYYDFNQASGTSLPLVYGTGNNGVLNNMDNSDWVAGQPNFGNALDFDGSDDFVHIADGYTNTVSGDNTHTVSMWVYPRAVSNDPLLLDAEDIGTHDYFIELGSGNSAYIAIAGIYRTYTGPALSLNTWHQIVVTKTGVGNSGDVYLDGTLLIFTGSFGSTPALASDFLLGKYKSGSFNINGLIDDLAFWDRDLSDAEVASLYSAGADLITLITPVPEPSTLALLSLGVIGLAIRHRRRRAAA